MDIQAAGEPGAAGFGWHDLVALFWRDAAVTLATLAAWLGALLHWLPTIATALVPVVVLAYWLIKIWETRTVRLAIGRRTTDRRDGP